MKIGYLEIKRAVDATKEQIEQAEQAIQISAIALKAFEKELQRHPIPEPKLRLKK